MRLTVNKCCQAFFWAKNVRKRFVSYMKYLVPNLLSTMELFRNKQKSVLNKHV